MKLKGDLSSFMDQRNVNRNSDALSHLKHKAFEKRYRTHFGSPDTLQGLTECITAWLEIHKHECFAQNGIVQTEIDGLCFVFEVTLRDQPTYGKRLQTEDCEYRTVRSLWRFVEIYNQETGNC